jgi:ATP-dependent RNA circularization protein (DNA/RNA ligase family)
LIAHYVRLSCLPINNAGRLACGQGLGQALIPASVEAVEAVEAVEVVAEVEQAVAEVEQTVEVVVDSKVLGAHLYQPRPAAMI